MKSDAALHLGARIRTLRRRHQLTQVRLAEKLGISASYLNLIEHGRRTMSAELLLRLAQHFRLELKELAGEDEEHTVADLLEAFGDPIFESYALTSADVRALATNAPGAARALLGLYESYRATRESARSLAERVAEGGELAGVGDFRLPGEEVSDLVQRHMNYFPDLEEAAERLWRDARLPGDDLFTALAKHLRDAHGAAVKIEMVQAMGGAVRRWDPDRRELRLSEVLRRGSRNFQLAHQIALLSQSATFERISVDSGIANAESKALARVALANYFAAAVLMPYEPFVKAAREERYDIELLGHRFRTRFEQVCHRLTTLRRPGAEGVPFHLVRADVAGNISKRFSGSGIRIARFSGACPRWTLHAAFLTPGMFRVQTSQMPDGTTYFCFARTIRKDGGGYHSLHAMQAVEMGCPVEYARELVYSDGVDLESPAAAKPVGVTCRLCERGDCEQRVFPPLQASMKVDENVRGVSFYAPVKR